MKPPRGNSFAERQQAAAEAKKRLLQKFEAAPKPDDPEVLAKRAEREALAAAREARRAETERVRKEAAEHRQAEHAAAKAAEAEARQAAELEEATRTAALEEERKAERDRRYAARKARKR